jgi:DNA-binding LacI/PurR family transcriptional regulator
MGAIATETLVNKIEGNAPSMVSKIVLDVELIIRKSCGYNLYGYKR